MEANAFDPAIPDSLLHQIRVDLSKEKPEGKVCLWIKENKPKIFSRAVNFEEAWSAAVDACDMKAVKDALIGMKGAWLHGFREYNSRQKK